MFFVLFVFLVLVLIFVLVLLITTLPLLAALPVLIVPLTLLFVPVLLIPLLLIRLVPVELLGALRLAPLLISFFRAALLIPSRLFALLTAPLLIVLLAAILILLTALLIAVLLATLLRAILLTTLHIAVFLLLTWFLAAILCRVFVHFVYPFFAFRDFRAFGIAKARERRKLPTKTTTSKPRESPKSHQCNTLGDVTARHRCFGLATGNETNHPSISFGRKRLKQEAFLL
ncbi:MAG TPA: hypothetical protein VGO67_00395 [Verrucomicrobiae bacterium]